RGRQASTSFPYTTLFRSGRGEQRFGRGEPMQFGDERGIENDRRVWIVDDDEDPRPRGAALTDHGGWPQRHQDQGERALLVPGDEEGLRGFWTDVRRARVAFGKGRCLGDCRREHLGLA